MIRAHMATFPARADILPAAVARISAQVDRLYLVLNEYKDIPPEISANSAVEAIIPEEDLKDVGKFVFKPALDDIVFFVDDDIHYPPDYVTHSLRQAEGVGLDSSVFGYHCSTYNPQLERGANSRRIKQLWRRSREMSYVDQIGTGTMVALGKNVPSLEYMSGSQKFVDVRYAKWLCENGINSISLKRRRMFLQERGSENPEDRTIWESFTRNSPDYVLDEIKSFAGKNPLVGKLVGEVQEHGSIHTPQELENNHG